MYSETSATTTVICSEEIFKLYQSEQTLSEDIKLKWKKKKQPTLLLLTLNSSLTLYSLSAHVHRDEQCKGR